MTVLGREREREKQTKEHTEFSSAMNMVIRENGQKEEEEAKNSVIAFSRNDRAKPLFPVREISVVVFDRVI